MGSGGLVPNKALTILCIVNSLPHSDLLPRPRLRGHRFPWFYRHLSSVKRVHSIVKLGDIVKTLRIVNLLSRSIFSMAGSFGNGVRKNGVRNRCPYRRCLGTKNQPEVFQTEVFSWTSARHVRAKMLVFPGFGRPDQSFWPDVRRDVRFGLNFRF